MVMPAAKADDATQKKVADRYAELSDREKWLNEKDEPKQDTKD